jgi:hypothetical protein
MPSTKTTDHGTGISDVAAALPEFWTQEAPPVADRAAWIPWPIAVLLVPLLWVLPKRMGLHFGRVAWPGVILGHLLWTVYGIGCVYLAFEAPRTGLPGYIAQAFESQAQHRDWPLTLSEAIRSPAALLASQIIEWSMSGTQEFAILIGGTLLAVVGIAVLGGVLLMPWSAGGEKRWRLFARCAKLALWSTSCGVVLGLALQVIALALLEPEPDLWTSTSTQELSDVAWLLAPLMVACWLWIWLRSAVRHVGATEGPDSEPRRPRCESCGYGLTGLTPAGNCPECGRSVASSMPDKRHTSSFAAAHNVWERIAGYVGVLFRVVFDASYIERIRLQSGWAQARYFALWSAVLTGPTAFAMYWILGLVLPESGPPVLALFSLHFLQTLLVVWVGAALLLVMVISLILLPVLLLAGPFRPRAMVVFYNSAWALPLAVNAAVVVHVSCWSLSETAFWRGWGAIPLVTLGSVTVVWGLQLALLVIVHRRIRQAWRWACFTNA